MKVGATMVEWLALLPHSRELPGLDPGRGLSAWSLLFLPVPAWVASGHSGFLPQSCHDCGRKPELVGIG